MEFDVLLHMAKMGNKEAQESIYLMYQPLLMKHSIIDNGIFCEDLHQELSQVLLECIRKFVV